jgi:hypothetical protein
VYRNSILSNALVGINLPVLLNRRHCHLFFELNEEVLMHVVIVHSEGIWQLCPQQSGALPLCANLASVVAFPSTSGTAAKYPHYNMFCLLFI